MAKFQPGQSGNPAGRKPGTGHLQQWRAKINADMPKILESLSDAALAGDTQAAALLLNRAFPSVKSTLPEVDLPLSASDPAQAAQTVVQAVASGAISPDVAASLMESINKLQAISQLPNIESRLKRIEELLNASN